VQFVASAKAQARGQPRYPFAVVAVPQIVAIITGAA